MAAYAMAAYAMAAYAMPNAAGTQNVPADGDDRRGCRVKGGTRRAEEEGGASKRAKGFEETLHPAPYTLHPTPYTLHPTLYTLHPTPYVLNP